MKKIMIAVAPVAKSDLPGINNPESPEDIAEVTVACAEAGASLVHLHVRDEKGRQTADTDVYSKTLDLIRKKSGILIQGSTGGLSSLSLEERCTALNDPRTQVASLNMGSTNFSDTVYINTLEDIRYWSKRIRETEVVPEMEIFTGGMIHSIEKLVKEGVIPALPEKRLYNFALGFDGALPATMETLCWLKSQLPPGAEFSVLHEGFQNFSFLAGALAMGATGIRVGFEDGIVCTPGKEVRDNVVLVEKAVDLIHSLGMEVMTIEEAKKHMCIIK